MDSWDERSERALVWHFPHVWGPKGPGLEPFSAIERGDWKLIYFHTDRRVELYDLAHDVGEAHDLASARPEVVESLRAELRRELETSLVGMPTDRATGAIVSMP